MKNKKIIKENAITLVALVITVIILIILAGVSLNLALGQNGIFVKSKQAVDKYKDSAQREQNEMDNLYNTLVGLGKKGDDDVTPGDDPTTGEPVEYSELNIGDYVNYPVKYDNVDTYVSYSDGLPIGYYPESKYAGKWRIISIDENHNEVKLISAGVPLNYYHRTYGDASKSIENLTINFFSADIKYDKKNAGIPENDQFYQSGFKDGANGNYVIDKDKLKELFSNELTKKRTDSETPEVQSMTKEDVDKVYGSTTNASTYVYAQKFKELLAIPCDEPKKGNYAFTWLASSTLGNGLDNINNNGQLRNNYMELHGVRPVVTLKANVKFTPADTNVNDTTTWDIAAPENS